MLLTPKQVIYGHVVRIVGKYFYVQNGDSVDVYNSDYYRVVNEGR